MNDRAVDPAAQAGEARSASPEPMASQPSFTAPAAPTSPVADTAPPRVWADRLPLWALSAVALVALLVSALLWQKLSNIQEQLARQSAESGAQAVEARALARQAVEATRDATSRLAVMENRLGEVALQRSQLEELMQSLSRSRDENLVVDIEAAIRLAQQQAQLTGSVEPLLASLRSADQRLARSAQPRLARVRAAIARDIERIKAANLVDVPSMLVRLDELLRQVDELTVANAVADQVVSPPRRTAAPAVASWWEQAWAAVLDELRSLVRVSRVDQPEALLIAPEQAFFLRENLKLKLLNARLGLLSRQPESARSDLGVAAAALSRYFDPASRRTQAALGALQQLQAQARSVEVPRVDETLAALTTAAAGR